MRSLVAAIALGVVAVATAGCGGDDDPFESYCKEVVAQRDTLSEDLGGGDATSLIDALPVFEKLRAKSPEDLRDEWDTVTARIGDLKEALEDAGVDPSSYDRKNPPTGLTREQRTAINEAAQALATPEMKAALDGVEQQARDVCRTPLVV